MKIGRASAGESRACPHCQATILKSATACPICRHMLRAHTLSFEAKAKLTACPLSIEGNIDHPGANSPLKDQVLMEIRDDAGRVVSR